MNTLLSLTVVQLTTCGLIQMRFIFLHRMKNCYVTYGKSMPSKYHKIHSSSNDGQVPSIRQATIPISQPIQMPDHKPNPNKQIHREITNIDIHKYMGFCTLKSLKPFQVVSKNNISLVNAGEIPLQHGNFATMHCHRSNKDAVTHPSHFFDVTHMDITYGNTVAPGGIKFALLIVDRKTR